ncbi:MAG: hypothetical protein PPHEMADMSA_3031 [uncultured Paraburkholderia sp.]|nr:MAG: hypothetical protein PPHEMADMSA_3031 [uncultured Paraburkholderia sp.]
MSKADDKQMSDSPDGRAQAARPGSPRILRSARRRALLAAGALSALLGGCATSPAGDDSLAQGHSGSPTPITSTRAAIGSASALAICWCSGQRWTVRLICRA